MASFRVTKCLKQIMASTAVSNSDRSEWMLFRMLGCILVEQSIYYVDELKDHIKRFVHIYSSK